MGVSQGIELNLYVMAKSFKSWKNPQLEVVGFVAGATLSIPAIILAGFGVYQLIKNLF